ncbi:hypothetical protein NYA9BBAC_01215 [Salinibacterium sp. NYA9b]
MTSATSAPVRVEVWSDPQCVWCLIAHLRFEKAVAAFEGEVDVAYRSVEVRLDAADETGNRAALFKRHFTAYFTEGRRIGRKDELVDLAHEVGLDRDSAREALTDRRHREAVDRDGDRLRYLRALLTFRNQQLTAGHLRSTARAGVPRRPPENYRSMSDDKLTFLTRAPSTDRVAGEYEPSE